MNPSKYILCVLFLITTLVACKKDNYDDISFINTASAPGKLSALFDITQDNTGLVTITPNGEGIANFDIYFGDATTVPVNVLPGKNTKHTYAEGVYNVKIVGRNGTGATTEAIQKLTVSFRAPENLVANVGIDPANNLKVNVSAKADYETFFKVYYGDGGPNEVPVSFLEGATVSHIYTAVGTYNVRIVALSGGAATTEVTKRITIVDPLILPITFESGTVDYTFNNFAGGGVTTSSNPSATGINTSAKVGKMIKSAGQTYGGSLIKVSGNIDFNINKVFRMKVYSPRVGAKVLLKVENASDGTKNFEKEVATTVANSWEDLVFDYRAINTANTYQNIVLIFDNGTMGDGSTNFTYYFDDIRLANSLPNGTTQINLPVTFDNASVNYTLTDFGGAQTGDALDPTNAANNVKKTLKPIGAETYAGTTMGTNNLGFSSKIPFTTTATQMSVRVYSPAVGIPVRLKVEDRTNPGISVETEAKTTVANAWETLIFDFANQSSGTAAFNVNSRYDKATIFFDFNAAGSGKVFYWDDVNFLTSNIIVGGINLPLNFESTSLTYTFTDFGGGKATIVANPSATGINTSTKVGKMVKGAPEVYGGSFITLDNPINFSTRKTFKVKVFSPRVGAKLLLKVENLTNGGISYEKQATTTTANAWEELTFDYSGIDTGLSYQKVVLIFDLGTVGDGSANFTYYFDDITLN